MNDFILVTGGSRSGKSSLAEEKAKNMGKKIVYIATAIAFDNGMKDRIKKHRESRPSEWMTIEKYENFKDLNSNNDFLEADTILLDCMTLMVSNLILESGLNFDKASATEIDRLESRIFKEVKQVVEVVKEHNKNLIIVTNEVGMGLVPSYKLGSIFRDVSGRINQYLAKEANEVYFTVSGIPMKIK